MDRRQFGKMTSGGLLALAVGGSVSLTGCNVFSDILNWIPTAVSAINGIVTVLGSFLPPGAGAIVTLIDAALASLSATITEYNNDANPADKATLLAKIRTILTDIGTNFQSFLSALNLGNNPIIAIVIGLAQVILGAIQGFLGQLPAGGSGTKILSSAVTVGQRTMPVEAKYYKTVRAFKKDYNEVCILNHRPDIELR
jgi:hypothetical protein